METTPPTYSENKHVATSSHADIYHVAWPLWLFSHNLNKRHGCFMPNSIQF